MANATITASLALADGWVPIVDGAVHKTFSLQAAGSAWVALTVAAVPPPLNAAEYIALKRDTPTSGWSGSLEAGEKLFGRTLDPSPDHPPAIVRGVCSTERSPITLAAGEAHIGALGGDTPAIAVTPVVQAAAYAAGQVIGGKYPLAGLARLAGGTGVYLSGKVFLKIPNASAIDLVIFNADPVNSTITDKAAFAVAGADFDKISDVIHITDWTSFSATSFGKGLSGVGYKIPAGATDGFVVPVARGAITFASTSDMRAAVNVSRD